MGRGATTLGGIAGALLAVFLLAAEASACACCAEAGHWSQVARKATPDELAELGRVRLGATAALVVPPAGLEHVRGVAPAAPRYALRHQDQNRQWTLELSADGARGGSFTFVMPDTGEFYAVDPRDGGRDAAGSPRLYKEWRFTGAVAPRGVFRGTRFHLVLQGRGNLCPDAAQFTGWILRVIGPNASYALFGDLREPAPRR